MILAVDFDGTLCDGNKNPNTALFAQLRQRQRAGDIVILWTCRSGKTLQEAVTFCMAHGLRPNYVNENAPQAIAMFGGDTRKIFADIYIDDKAVRV